MTAFDLRGLPDPLRGEFQVCSVQERDQEGWRGIRRKKVRMTDRRREKTGFSKCIMGEKSDQNHLAILAGQSGR